MTTAPDELNLESLQEHLSCLADPERASHHLRFFRCGPGEYGEGDRFMGITVPQLRAASRTWRALPLHDLQTLLKSPWHEARQLSLFILVYRYGKSRNPQEKQEIFDLYLSHTAFVNNWDLVDCSAEHIVGPHLVTLHDRLQDFPELTRLAASPLLWERRIAMLATFHTLKRGLPEEALRIATLLQQDTHDLIHKAVGWMLRECGQRCGRSILEDWLLENARYKRLPRTTLRYAIEHFSPEDRQQWLRGMR
jgi:3-methyladenine DNA glycosylase AlkD